MLTTGRGWAIAEGAPSPSPPPLTPFGGLCMHVAAPDKRNRAALEPSDLGAEEAQGERSMIDGVLVGL